MNSDLGSLEDLGQEDCPRIAECAAYVSQRLVGASVVLRMDSRVDEFEKQRVGSIPTGPYQFLTR